MSRDFDACEEEQMIRRHYSSYLMGETEGLRDTEESISFLGKLASTAVRHGILVDLPLSLELVCKALCEEETDAHKSLKEVDMLSTRYIEDGSKNPLLTQQQRMLNSFAEGISSVTRFVFLMFFTH